VTLDLTESEVLGAIKATPATTYGGVANGLDRRWSAHTVVVPPVLGEHQPFGPERLDL
jgi:hypothetical protein